MKRKIVHQYSMLTSSFLFVFAGPTVTVEALLVRLLQMLFDLSLLAPSAPEMGGVNDKTFDPVQMLAHLFQEMSSGSEGSRHVLCNVSGHAESIIHCAVTLPLYLLSCVYV